MTDEAPEGILSRGETSHVESILRTMSYVRWWQKEGEPRVASPLLEPLLAAFEEKSRPLLDASVAHWKSEDEKPVTLANGTVLLPEHVYDITLPTYGYGSNKTRTLRKRRFLRMLPGKKVALFSNNTHRGVIEVTIETEGRYGGRAALAIVEVAP